MEELLDLYDFKKQKIGKTWLRGVNLPQDTYRCTMHICIFNSEGKMLIQKRTDDRSVFSSLWDVTVGGGVKDGDDAQSTATKELKEELGIDYDFSNERPFLTIHFTNGFDDIFVINKDIDLKDLTLQKTEVADVKWATEEEIMQMINDEVFIPYRKQFISWLFVFKDNRGAIVKK